MLSADWTGALINLGYVRRIGLIAIAQRADDIQRLSTSHSPFVFHPQRWHGS